MEDSILAAESPLVVRLRALLAAGRGVTPNSTENMREQLRAALRALVRGDAPVAAATPSPPDNEDKEDRP